MSRLADEVGNLRYLTIGWKKNIHPKREMKRETACAKKKKKKEKKKMKKKKKKKMSSARFILPALSSIMSAGALRQPVVPFTLSLQSRNTVPRHVL